MSIDKDSSGFPEVNVHRRTTKVNLWMIVFIGVFLVVATGAAYWVAVRAAAPASATAGE